MATGGRWQNPLVTVQVDFLAKPARAEERGYPDITCEREGQPKRSLGKIFPGCMRHEVRDRRFSVAVLSITTCSKCGLHTIHGFETCPYVAFEALTAILVKLGGCLVACTESVRWNDLRSKIYAPGSCFEVVKTRNFFLHRLVFT